MAKCHDEMLICINTKGAHMTAASNSINQIVCPNCNVPFTIDESGYAEILKQVHDKEFEAKLLERMALLEKTQAAELELAQQRIIAQNAEALSASKSTIQELQAKIQASEIEKQLALSEKSRELEKERDSLASQIKILQAEHIANEAASKASTDELLKLKDEQIAQYKDFKAKLSTKLVGESLEKHCEAEFNTYRAGSFPKAYFEKDTNAKSGSQGDYIFRESSDDGVEYISIMFEMKNENDETATKKKNEDFFKELDKDRNEKGCEYAILVSLLEPENEFYNNGIVDVSHRYPKMYVIRPQFFIPMITLLRNAAVNTLASKRELAQLVAQQVDVEKFESKLDATKKKFDNNVRLAESNYDDAIKTIKKAIKDLQDTLESLEDSAKYLRRGNQNLADVTVRSLTHGNSTMKKMFDDARRTIDGEVEEEAPLEIEG
jgi:hypothetical protein